MYDKKCYHINKNSLKRYAPISAKWTMKRALIKEIKFITGRCFIFDKFLLI